MAASRRPTISGGRLRGRRLAVPAGRLVRPTRSLVRQALFNMLGEQVVDAHVLDLYSGSGALGLEALSRGAAHVVFVERDRHALASLRDNLASCEVPASSFRLLPVDARTLALASSGPFDLVLADPPFALVDALPPDLEAEGVLAPEAWLARHLPAERAPESPGAGWHLQRQRTYGRSLIEVWVRAS